MKKLVMYRCEKCGNIILMIKDSGVNPDCCGSPMTLIEPNTADTTSEKHLPIINQKGIRVFVQVGIARHPMTEEHYIEWIILQTSKGAYARVLDPSKSPEATFTVSPDEDVCAAYAYCNVHGLWRTDYSNST